MRKVILLSAYIYFKQMKKKFNYLVIIIVFILLIKIFISGIPNFSKNKIEWAIILILGLYFLISTKRK
ncbi:MAG: hypothetical protein COZ16_12215 [Flavobacteriaceae bacterium CG_4_10_14_3_um_filter_31_253]|nr:MAG: hypothetical protein COW43_02250 [Flavobacteriaceae bacterium CG17_big_fil_post_rev_8_21_14_2_50_31_13]PIX12345.1 MAG: hypothetical protein COZ74_11605 [Flavobacteriaceae bacterium CG_4_8_14_3_um_filter_31_8]PIY13850.1 MAG: hypothetical protein COZ16_12215 [Flavobacteriaceae bacterium CG_4_10_14_3_um_filter_31_253]PIZ09558.1 MAG: hypothetical protein COY55_12190 [Flavobacteriaceae bacterium CG_4_10_14_0_8_um_filter_31_99]PJC10108.1 MAG: hypothetical protein CO067_06390 [Flavobacteriacea